MATTPRPRPLYDGQRYDASRSVGAKVSRLVTMMRREVELRVAEHGLTDAQWKPLWFIGSGRAANAIELAREMAIGAGAVTRLLDRLEAKGLIERERSARDRRVVHLRLTPAGQAVAAQVPPVLAAVNNDFLRGFSAAEWKQLLALLSRMLDNGQSLQAEREAS